MKNNTEKIINNFVFSSKENKDYEQLIIYFLSSYLTYSVPERSLALYPGFRSHQGKLGDKIEGFYRILPVMAAWIYSGRSSVINLKGFGRVDIEQIIRDGIVNAVTPSSPGYYGEISDYDSRIIAASVIALSLWYLKDTLWINMSQFEKCIIVDWLNGVNKKKIVDNNWHLFIVMTNAVLKHLGVRYSEEDYQKHYLRHKSFYRGNGWYSDGPEMVLNYYNAWEVHPYLIWIDQVDPTLDRAFIRKTTKEFLESYIHFFSSSGFPIFGRSVCYRMALPTPLVLAEAFGWPPLRTGQARAALNAIWEYFLRNGAVKNGLITQGYWGEDLDFLDNYSGPASCNWSLMSIVAALTNPPDSPFWQEDPSPLPVEISSYKIYLEDIDMTVVGDKPSGDISVFLKPDRKYSSTQRIRYSLPAKLADKLIDYFNLKETVFWRYLPYKVKALTHRPDNAAMKYGLTKYSSMNPFCRSSK